MLRSGKQLETKGKSPVIEEVEVEKIIQPGQNDGATKEQLNERQSVENSTEVKTSLSVPYPQRLKKHKLDK